MRVLNALTLFVAAWACGLVGFTSDYAGLIITGGALLLAAATLVATRPADPLNRVYDAFPNHGPFYAGVPRGWPRRAMTALILGGLGAGWIIYGFVQ